HVAFLLSSFSSVPAASPLLSTLSLHAALPILIGGPARKTALLLPRGRDTGDGPNGFHVNRTAAAAHIRPRQAGASWRLILRSGSDRKSTRLNSSHVSISYAVFCLKKKIHTTRN